MEELVRLAAIGHKPAQAKLFCRYQPLVLNFLRQRGLEEELVEEISQEAFISVFEALPFYNGRAKLSTWICAIVKHELVDYYRKKKIKTVLFSVFPRLEGLASRSLGPEMEFEKKELVRKVKKALSLLTEGYERVLRLKYIEGLSVREIASQLNLTQKTVESRLTRARKAFARVYAIIDQSG
ncbi:sigma-70 family RNA polymerase sigma factor [Patescibacteria group bacterium]|nr:sigma-70 family RNA polymerase sigma factor [Patescibacteria group bacterium]